MGGFKGLHVDGPAFDDSPEFNDVGLHTPKKVVRNAIKCLVCGTELESKFRHDFQQCNCANRAFVDGGQDYSRVGARNLKAVAVLTASGEYVPLSCVNSWHHTITQIKTEGG